jgi:hypothetical protein
LLGCGRRDRLHGRGADAVAAGQVGAGETREQLAVVHERLAEILGGGPAGVAVDADGVGVTVVAEHPRVLDRELRHPAVEVGVRVATLGREDRNQLVRVADGSDRVVHELLLNGDPAVPIASAVLVGHVGERQCIVVLEALTQFRLGRRLVALLGDQTVILVAEATTQVSAPTEHPVRAKQDRGDDYHRDHDPNDCHGMAPYLAVRRLRPTGLERVRAAYDPQVPIDGWLHTGVPINSTRGRADRRRTMRRCGDRMRTEPSEEDESAASSGPKIARRRGVRRIRWCGVVGADLQCGSDRLADPAAVECRASALMILRIAMIGSQLGTMFRLVAPFGGCRFARAPRHPAGAGWT